MKKSNILFRCLLLVIAFIISWLIVTYKSTSKQQKEPFIPIDQSNGIKSLADSLNTVQANKQLQEKDSIINLLNLKLTQEKTNTLNYKSAAQRQHILNDSLNEQYQREKNLETCEYLVQGQKLEIGIKDSVIESLDRVVSHCSMELNELVEKVEIQQGVINSKQDLLVCKDSTISFYQEQKKKKDFWNNVKIKLANIIIITETIVLLLKST